MKVGVVCVVRSRAVGGGGWYVVGARRWTVVGSMVDGWWEGRRRFWGIWLLFLGRRAMIIWAL